MTSTPLPEGLAAVEQALERAIRIEHAAWHLLDDAVDVREIGEIAVDSDRVDALSELLTEEHPDSIDDEAPSPSRAALSALRAYAEHAARVVALVAEDHDNPACRQEGCRYAAALAPFVLPPETEEANDARQ